MSKLVDAAEEQEEDHYDDLAQFIMRNFERARRHRDSIGVTESIKDCLERYRSKYDCEELMKFDGIDLYIPMTHMMVETAYSWLKDAYFNAQDKPWTLEPTPEPELPDDLKAELETAIESQLVQALGPTGPLGLEQAPRQTRSLIEKLRNTASEMAFNFAMESSKGMSKVIEDQLTEAEFNLILHEIIKDFLIYPYCVVKGPVIKNKTVPVWDKNKYKFKETQGYYVERVDPRNFFFSPDSTDAQDGEFVVEIMNMSRSNLNIAKKMKGFDEDAINLVIEEADMKYSRQAELRVDDNDYESLDGVGREMHDTNGYIFDVYAYHGRISGQHILEFHEMDSESDKAMEDFDTVDTKSDWGVVDPYEDYEVEVWVSNGVVVMLRENAAKPIPHRPYYSTSAYKVPGSAYGTSIPMIVADHQDEVNTAARARKYNMGMSSGPIVEADVSRFTDNKVPDQIMPWDVYPVQTNSMQGNNAAPALRFNNIPSQARELTQVMVDVWERAHSIAGIPPYMYGESQGAAPTLGAFSLQYAGATKRIKTMISNLDHDIIEKLIQQMYYYNMIYHDDEFIKADAKVHVRGSAGLIAQEQRQARPLELLQALGPILAQMQPETALALANETLRESGYDPQSLGSSSAEKEASNRLIGENTQPPPTDGRSGNADQIPQQANLPSPV